MFRGQFATKFGIDRQYLPGYLCYILYAETRRLMLHETLGMRYDWCSVHRGITEAWYYKYLLRPNWKQIYGEVKPLPQIQDWIDVVMEVIRK
jgi:hypothetical protein